MKQLIQKISIATLCAFLSLGFLSCSKSIDYKVLDEIQDESHSGKTQFLFVHVSNLDSLGILKAGKEIFKERVLNKYDGTQIPEDQFHDEMPVEILIAYFYRQEDTTAVPDQMKDLLRSKFPKNDIVRYNLNYISEGFIYSAVYDPFSKKTTIDSLSPKTMLFVPKSGTLAKDVMRSMDEEHNHEDVMKNHPDIDSLMKLKEQE